MQNVRRTTVLVLAVALFACGRKAGYDAPEYKAAADAAKSGFVAPLRESRGDFDSAERFNLGIFTAVAGWL